MDYSASIQESDHAGDSPWGSPEASPQRNRHGFGNSGDAPQSPYQRPFTASSSNLGSERDEIIGGFGGSASGDPDYRRPGTASSVARTDESASETAAESVAEAGSNSNDDDQPSQQHPYDQAPLPPKPNDNGAPAPSSDTAGPALNARALPQYKLQAKITALERTGRKADPIFRFDIHTNLPRFRTTQYRDVRRMHSEFEKLAEHLISANPEALVPAVPGPVTSAGAGTEEDEIRVKAQMQRWFNYVCSNEVLVRDDEMVLFVESDFGYSPMVKKKQPATGVRRKILKQFAPPADDTPELQQARPTADFGVKLGAMNVQEPHAGLANAYRKLGKTIQTAGDYQAVQATAEATTIGDPLEYHSADALIAKETLTNRQLLLRERLQAQEATRTRLNAADRLKGSANVRREKHETALNQKTARVTQYLVQERRLWFTRTATDMRRSVRELVLREIEAERRTLALLESVRADIRNIDGSGGLSRLGREALHAAAAAGGGGGGGGGGGSVRRTSLAASQGPKGDAWSGVPRRSDAVLNRGVGGIGAGGLTAAAAAAAAAGAGASGSGDDSTGPLSPGDEYDANGNLLHSSIVGAISEEEDDDRVDARNAASRLAASTF
ncbi:vacuolar protein sorting-associated protein vps17 [Niveomyces insectorum RCEF 264]|uniref:Vacuolar protein sorting-associated protein 17 n=1 Tax=Niveomyces insectorum RCEF 264 TaxID=1081102 RepID=A0A167PUR8_9HYPO|nr:vacuolar protein sorting-associated protein vps17 [Niveomyces insectorum RCEF 264]